MKKTQLSPLGWVLKKFAVLVESRLSGFEGQIKNTANIYADGNAHSDLANAEIASWLGYPFNSPIVSAMNEFSQTTANYGDVSTFELVDLGLPSGNKWANMNIGATSENGVGYYYSWGNIDGHDMVNDYYEFSSSNYQSTSGYSLSSNITTANDAAYAYYEGDYRIPSQSDYAELFNSDYTYQSPGDLNGVPGVFISSNTNGKAIFFPYTGYAGDGEIYGYLSEGCYITSTYESSSTFLSAVFSALDGVGVYGEFPRYCGYNIRAVVHASA